MNVKIDTKEKFNEIWLLDDHFTANMTAEIREMLTDFLNKPVKNTILVLDNVSNMDPGPAKALGEQQNKFYESNASFVICGLQPQVEELFEKLDILDGLNVTPTLSEAWDIVQMEEIEREMLDDF